MSDEAATMICEAFLLVFGGLCLTAAIFGHGDFVRAIACWAGIISLGIAHFLAVNA